MVKISKRLLTILDSAEKFCAPAVRTDNYPDSIVDLLIFHRMHFHMTPKKARRCFNHLKSEFVDWTEVRRTLDLIAKAGEPRLQEVAVVGS